jgi:16S rRNA (guanine1207-N2)-methyltransferase
MPKIPLEELKVDKEIRTKLRNNLFIFKTTWGLFCPEEIDIGTRLLLEHIPKQKEDARILDIGCGYGPIGIALGPEVPKGSIEMIDKDFVAIDYTKINIKENATTLNGTPISVYLSNGFSHVPKDTQYDLIVSNLPAKVGKEFFWIMFGEADTHMKSGSVMIVVAIRQLEPMLKKSFEAVFGNSETIGRDNTYSIVRTIKN